MNSHINIALLKLNRRAEQSDPEVLVSTFVDTGTLQAMLTSRDHQIIYGRRGTGKTHALTYLAENKKQTGDVCIYIDMRTIGSSVGLFADQSTPLAERATRLLRDTLLFIHQGLMDQASTEDGIDLSAIAEYSDAFLNSAVEIEVIGTSTVENQTQNSEKSENSAKISLSASEKGFGIGLDAQNKLEQSNAAQIKYTNTGSARHRIRFGSIIQNLRKITDHINPHRIWILLDEWSSVPPDLQPYLADMIRRCILPVRGISVKIAAIEYRSHFAIHGDQGEYTGIEIGADMTADLNLDDFMVFDNDAGKATDFFTKLFFNHVKASIKENSIPVKLESIDDFTRLTFTQKTVLDEIVRAAEGVPRDAINILALAAQKASNTQISIINTRSAAKTWYQRDKESAVSSNPESIRLLRWIVDEVIAHRKARAFLTTSGLRDNLIDSLFDARVLHILKKNISSQDNPGGRYDAFKIDYGCYVDLLTTTKEPVGLFPIGEQETTPIEQYIDVPPDDYRAIRRAILEISTFYKKNNIKVSS